MRIHTALVKTSQWLKVLPNSLENQNAKISLPILNKFIVAALQCEDAKNFDVEIMSCFAASIKKGSIKE